MPIVSGGSGGATVLARGAVIQRSANVALNSGDPLPFDTVFSDPSGYFDAVNKRFVIPAGKGGQYVYGAKIETEPLAALSGLWVSLSVSGSAANCDFTGARKLSAGDPRYEAIGAVVDVFAAGDTISPLWELDGVAAATLTGGGNGSTFYIAYLGPLA